MSKKQRIMQLLKAGESGHVGNIFIEDNEVEMYYCGGIDPLDEVPENLGYEDYEEIAEYIIHAYNG